MRVPSVLAFLILLSAVGSAGWLYAQQRTPPGMLSPQDFLKIEQLVQGYTRGIDIGRP